jgi:hypothetical protein
MSKLTKKLIKNIDFTLLKSQKENLFLMIEDWESSTNEAKRNSAKIVTGLVTLLDLIQEVEILVVEPISYPIEYFDTNGNNTYFESSTGYWAKREYNTNGKCTYCEDSNGYWFKCEFDTNGNKTYFEDSRGNRYKY